MNVKKKCKLCGNEFELVLLTSIHKEDYCCLCRDSGKKIIHKNNIAFINKLKEFYDLFPAGFSLHYCDGYLSIEGYSYLEVNDKTVNELGGWDNVPQVSFRYSTTLDYDENNNDLDVISPLIEEIKKNNDIINTVLEEKEKG
jgi:hypothetical protein